MTNIFQSVAKNVQAYILFAWPLGVILALMALALMYEDYATSYYGYLALPTLKANYTWMPFIVAGLPQVGQIVLFYVFGRDTSKGWAAALATSFFAIDVATDAWYKSGQDWSLIPLAIIESLFVFTLGSEVLFTVAFGFIFETVDEFIIALTSFWRGVASAFGVGMETLGITEKQQDQRGEYGRK